MHVQLNRSPFPTGESSGVLLNSLNGGGHLYVPTLSQIGTMYPFYGLSLRFVSWRKSHIAAMVNTSQVCKLENVSHSCNHQHPILPKSSAIGLSPFGVSKTIYRLTKKQIHDFEMILDGKININKQGESWNAIKYIVKIISAMTLIPAPLKKL
jgi:hypothetical protein